MNPYYAHGSCSARVPVALLLLVLAGLLSLATVSAADLRQSDRHWQVYSGDWAGTKYSALDQINRDNVSELEVAWVHHTGDTGSTIECNPIVVDGVMYVTSPGLKVMALDGADGTRLWEFDPWEGGRGGGVNRGVTYWADESDRRIFFVAGNYLHALNAVTGDLIGSFGNEGKVDLREGLDRDVFYLSATATSPGVIYRDLLILGSVVGEGPNPAAPGHIRAYDVRTGKREWIFHTIPHPDEPGYETWPADAWKTAGGANAWGGFTLDPKRGLVFCGTGSPSYDHYGGNRIGQNLYGNCILALDAETGRRKWHFQVVHHDLWDYDVPCPPNLVTVIRGGQEIAAIAQPTKMGHLFVLDRDTGQPLFPVEERPVPQTELPGEETWPTQPFPVKPPAYAQQRFTKDEATNLTPEARAAVLKRLEEMRTGDIFLPPGLEPSVTLPQFNGGTDWGGAAFDPKSQILYVNCSNESEWLSMVKAQPDEETTYGRLGQKLYGAICSNCHGFENLQAAGGAAFPSLKDIEERLTQQEVFDLLETGRGQMPSFATLSDTEKEAVVAFLFDDETDTRIKTEDLQLSWAQDIPYVATGHNVFKDPNGYPVNQRPWGTLSAIDLNEGRILWQTPLGTYPELEAQGFSATGTFNMGGPVVTAGGLVFIGGAMDERFHAYDKETGTLLWEFQMKAGGYATPATYEIDGRQYVVIGAGGGGKPGTKKGDAYYCFALPKDEQN